MSVELIEKTKISQDTKLVEAARRGDPNAYTQLVAKYHKAIYFQILKIVHNSSDAEDLTVEVLGKAYMQIDKYSSEYAFSTWLFRIARNHSIDYLRRKKQNHLSIDSEDYSSVTNKLVTTTPNPEETAMLKQRNKILKDMIKGLSPKHTKIIELRYFEELSYGEIGEALEIPIGTVKVQLFRARAKLMKLIESSSLNIR